MNTSHFSGVGQELVVYSCIFRFVNETVQLFARAIPFVFPPAVDEWSSFSASLPAFGVVICYFNHFDGLEVASHCSFKLNFFAG